MQHENKGESSTKDATGANCPKCGEYFITFGHKFIHKCDPDILAQVEWQEKNDAIQRVA